MTTCFRLNNVVAQFLCLLSVLLALCASASGQSEGSATERTIQSMELDLTRATLEGDLAASEKYLAAGFVRIYPDGSLAPTDDVRSEVKFTSIEIFDQQVHVTGDTAVSVFKAVVKASVHGHPLDGGYRCVRVWARLDGAWKAVAYSTTAMQNASVAAPPKPQTPPEQARVKDNVFFSDDLPKLTLTLDPKFKYLGNFPFDIRGIAGGYRYVWGELDHGRHLRRVFIVQAEGFYTSNDGTYVYGTPNAAVLAGDAYQHNVWIYDNAQSAREQPGNESDLTQKFMQEHGYQWESQLIMSRFARPVGDSRKNEIIFFYFENLKDYTAKPVKDFPEDGVGTEQKAILGRVDNNSSKAFTVSH